MLNMMQRDAAGQMQLMPFSVSPCPAPAAALAEMAALTPQFQRLFGRVAQDSAFLQDALEPAARSDSFLTFLLHLLAESQASQPMLFLLTRNDYFFCSLAPQRGAAFRQVEINLIAAGYAALSAALTRLHRLLGKDTAWEARLLDQQPLSHFAAGFQAAHALYGYADAVILFVVHQQERNFSDQRELELALRAQGLRVRYRTLENLAADSELRQGHLWVGGERVSVVYYRAGYGPEDLRSEEAQRARARIAASSAVEVPTIGGQLAGTKRIQQQLARPEVLRRFASAEAAAAMERCFAGMYALDEANAAEVRTRALAAPEEFVLKPQREGGGHNFFGAALADRLHTIETEAAAAYVLMERIWPLEHPALLASPQGALIERDCVSEIGRYGVFLAEAETERMNLDAGYLVRTKPREVEESGVSAGYGYLSSLLAQ